MDNFRITLGTDAVLLLGQHDPRCLTTGTMAAADLRWGRRSERNVLL